ncbi:hypothetical protein ACD661_14975 [Legionella lytica]|uniref:Ankyrin repeat protein n=1 Tax=Legionella lytica TaxID=96232 RepID=A0ABW8DAY9_9GAMM
MTDSCPSTWKHEREPKQAIFSLLSEAELLSYEGWLCRGTQLPDVLKLKEDYAQNYLYVINNDTKVLYYITEDGNAETVSGKQFDFTTFEQELEKLRPYSSEEPDVWALSHQQFQNLITLNGGLTPKSHANPLMVAEIDFAPDDLVALNYLIRALIPFNELFGDLDIQLKRELVAHIIATSGAQYYPDALATLLINFTKTSPPVFSDLPVKIREEIAKTVFYAQRSLEVAEQMRFLYDEGFLAEGDVDWPNLSNVLKQSPEPKHYVAALKSLCREDLQLFSQFLENTQFIPENTFDLLAFLAKISKEHRLTYLRLSQHLLSPFIQDVSDAQLIEIFEQQVVQKFLQHVAYGQQDEAEALLQSEHNFAQKLLTASKNPFIDYSGRTFTSTAYEYAYWAMDTHMRRMLEKHMDSNTKKVIFGLLQHIPTAGGLEYLDGTGTMQRSAHFDFSELKKALLDYHNGYEERTMTEREAAWRDVGKAQRDVPAHVAHEYCRPDRAFHCCPKFNGRSLPRVLTLSSRWTIPGGTHSWFPLAPSTGLGFKDAAHRMWFEDGAGVSSGSIGTEVVSAEHDLKAITRLEKVRTADLKKSLNNLKPQAISTVSEAALCGHKATKYAKKVVKVPSVVPSIPIRLPLVPDLAIQEKEFNTLVRRLSDIALRLELKRRSKVYADASKAALLLSHKLQLTGETFFANPDAQALKAFKSSCKNIFASKEAQGLKEHRELWYQIHPILRGILGVLAALAIVPALIVSVTSKHGYAGTFFTLPETTSGQALSKLAFQQAKNEAEIEAEMAKFSK